MKARNMVLFVLVVLGVLLSACGMPQSEEIEAGADAVRADGRQDIASDIAGDGEKLVALSNTIMSGDSCQAQLKAAWQHVGDGKVKFLASIHDGCVGTDAEADWTEKFEDAAGQTWDEYQAAQ